MPNTKRKILLVCNAHLDPVWQWEWEEGAAAALSTFRTAADLCEAFDGFVFNHNEVILYEWVREYEPQLFERIKMLVKTGKWHIMGGWYLQPDCNMPSGESLVRQILLGRSYFERHFGVRPTTAINFDPFGHSRGLVQILAKSGFDSYLFCRPNHKEYQLENDDFIWEGYDGSRVLAKHQPEMYYTLLGQARQKVEKLIEARAGEAATLVLWGIGDHGGGPSRIDLEQLTDLIETQKEALDIQHAAPEDYFAEIRPRQDSLPVLRTDINPFAVGCYTSQAGIKHKHRQLENTFFSTEKMVTSAWAQGLIAYPTVELDQALHDLAFAQFHDILPGSSIQPVEEMALRLMDHGLEILSRLKGRAFFALTKGQPIPKENDIPIMVYNPHPFCVRQQIECEFMLLDQNDQRGFTDVSVHNGRQGLPSQVEKELSNLNLDWRKRVVFEAELAPSSMNRFDCQVIDRDQKPTMKWQTENGILKFETTDLEVAINTHTGLLDQYTAHGLDILDKNACRPLVILDNADPWGFQQTNGGFRSVIGAFSLLSPEDNLRISGLQNPALPPVRVVEDGPVRTVVEALLGYGDSYLCLRYKLPKKGAEIEIEARCYWNEKDRMLKLSFPIRDTAAYPLGQVAYGIEKLPAAGNEAVAQKWVALVSEATNTALTLINDRTYGLDYCYGELRLSLLRAPAYCCHPIDDRPLLPDDRLTARSDQGEHIFHYWLNAGPAAERLAVIDREALAHNEKPMALSFFPSGRGETTPEPFLTLSDDVIQVAAIKKAETQDALILRLFEPTGQARKTTIAFPVFALEQEIELKGFEIKTLCINLHSGEWSDTNLIEESTPPPASAAHTA